MWNSCSERPSAYGSNRTFDNAGRPTLDFFDSVARENLARVIQSGCMIIIVHLYLSLSRLTKAAKLDVFWLVQVCQLFFEIDLVHNVP
jgi:hypothetical protein